MLELIIQMEEELSLPLEMLKDEEVFEEIEDMFVIPQIIIEMDNFLEEVA